MLRKIGPVRRPDQGIEETNMTVSTSSGYVVFDKVEKTYDGRVLVVKSLDLTVARGEFLTMLGPSGSGKTTTLMMLAGFETATGGDIYLDGSKINHIPPHKRGLGMVFQNYALFPHMTIAENVAFPLKVRNIGKADAEAKVRKALDMVQMSGLGGRKPAQLSGGQQQRIALARALVFEPKLLLMDEPLGALDKQLREHMQYEIKRLHETLGITVVYVTHDQSEALTMSDRIAVFNDGRIQQLATPAELYEKPQNSFVAQFIGENNQLRGIVKEISGGRARVEIGNSGIIEALAIQAESGKPTIVSVRPERVEIEPMSSDIAATGRIEEVIYLGDHIRIRMNVFGNSEFIVKVRNGSGRRGFAVGEEVKIGWSLQDCRALDV
jgi:putative spermidine/putrescine transport system ATP-binding protein